MFVRFGGVDMGCRSITASADIKTGYWPFCFQLLLQSWSQSCLVLALAVIFELIRVQLRLQGSHGSTVEEAYEPHKADTEVEGKALR